MSRTSTPFRLVEEDPPQVGDAPLAAELSARRAQEPAAEGIDLYLRIENEGDRALRLENPYEKLSYTVQDAEGWPVTVPAPVRSARVHGPRRSPEVRAAYLALTSAHVDDRELDRAEVLAAPELEVPGGSALALALRIPSVLTAYGSTESGPPAPGVYRVSMILAFAWRDDEGRHSFLTRTAEPLTVELSG